MRFSPLAFLLAVLLPLAAGATPEAEVFSTLDRRAVQVGDTVHLTIEIVAGVSEDETALWVEALAQAAPEANRDIEVADAGPVERRWSGDILELRRRYQLRALRAGSLSVPAVQLLVPGEPLATRPQALRAFDVWPDDASQSVMPVVAEGRQRGTPFRRTGSAWLAAPDALVTAYHVVVGARKVRVRLPSGRMVSIREVWSLDPERDVAVLRIDPEETDGIPALVIAPRRHTTSTGAVAFTHGWPLGQVSAQSDGFDRLQSTTVAALYDGIGRDERLLRVAGNAVRPGDSGGPLLDARGRVLGVIVSGRSTLGDDELLREDLCLAADPLPALRQRRDRPVPLARALREEAEHAPAARAFEAATALVGPVRIPSETPRQRERLLDAVRQAPDDASLQFLAGSVFEALGDDDVATRAYRGAHAAGYFPAAYALGHHYLDIDPAHAADLFADVRQSSPYVHLGAMGHARALVLLSRWAEAEDAIRVVLDHDPDFPPALYLLGVTHLAQNREAEARLLARRLEVYPSWAATLHLLLRHEPLRPSTLQPLAWADLGQIPTFEERP